MKQVNKLLLQAGLALTSVAAILFAVRIILQQTIGGTWFWGGAMAAFAGPVAFALALHLLERSDAAGRESSNA